MNIPVIMIEMLVFALLFTIMCFKTTGGNNTVQVENYPPDIQEEYFKTHKRIPTAPLSKRVIITKNCRTSLFCGDTWYHGTACRSKVFYTGLSVCIRHDGVDRGL